MKLSFKEYEQLKSFAIDLIVSGKIDEYLQAMDTRKHLQGIMTDHEKEMEEQWEEILKKNTK